MIALLAIANPFLGLVQIVIDLVSAAAATLAAVASPVLALAFSWNALKAVAGGPSAAKLKKLGYSFLMSGLLLGAAPGIARFTYNMGQSIGDSLASTDPSKIQAPAPSELVPTVPKTPEVAAGANG